MDEQVRIAMIEDLGRANEIIKSARDILIIEVDLHNGSILVTSADQIAEVITNLKMHKE